MVTIKMKRRDVLKALGIGAVGTGAAVILGPGVVDWASFAIDRTNLENIALYRVKIPNTEQEFMVYDVFDRNGNLGEKVGYLTEDIKVPTRKEIEHQGAPFTWMGYLNRHCKDLPEGNTPRKRLARFTGMLNKKESPRALSIVHSGLKVQIPTQKANQDQMNYLETMLELNPGYAELVHAPKEKYGKRELLKKFLPDKK